MPHLMHAHKSITTLQVGIGSDTSYLLNCIVSTAANVTVYICTFNTKPEYWQQETKQTSNHSQPQLLDTRVCSNIACQCYG